MVIYSFAGIIAALVYFLSAPTGSADASTTSPQDSLSVKDRFIDNVAFGVGEKLSFDVNYGFINAGTASMEVVKMVEFKERQAYQIQTRALSNSFFSSIYRVEDEVESIFDADGMFSWRFQKKLREGSYRADKVYEFDQHGHVVFYEKDTLPVAPFVQDALSALYYIRTQPLQVGKSVFVEVLRRWQELQDGGQGAAQGDDQGRSREFRLCGGRTDHSSSRCVQARGSSDSLDDR